MKPSKFKIAAESSYLPYITQSFTLPGLKKNQVFLFQASPYEVKPGETVKLIGSGFSDQENHISFDEKYTIMATSSNGSEIIAKIPDNLSEGTYILSIYNKLGTNDPNIPVSIKITNDPKDPPSITKIEENDGIIEISGLGFGSSNTVITPLGNLENIKLRSKNTVSFKLEDLSNYKLMKNYQNGRPASFPLPIYIQNDHGVSTSSITVNISI
jgi:hypothetical protein